MILCFVVSVDVMAVPFEVLKTRYQIARGRCVLLYSI